MPGQGREVERDYTAAGWVALGEATPMLVETIFDVHLNKRAHSGRFR